MGQVFVSHSAKDDDGKDFLQKLFASPSHSHKAYFYSWEGPRPAHVETLRKRIADSSSLFVLLSPQIEKEHTLAWVACEVGIAVGLQKPVWVLEKLIGVSGPLLFSGNAVDVPIPGATGYIERPSVLKDLHTEPYYSLVASAGVGVPVGPDGLPLRRMDCPHDSCRAQYYYYFEGSTLMCPVCRKKITRER